MAAMIHTQKNKVEERFFQEQTTGRLFILGYSKSDTRVVITYSSDRVNRQHEQAHRIGAMLCDENQFSIFTQVTRCLLPSPCCCLVAMVLIVQRKIQTDSFAIRLSLMPHRSALFSAVTHLLPYPHERRLR